MAQRFTRQNFLPILALGVLVVVCYLSGRNGRFDIHIPAARRLPFASKARPPTVLTCSSDVAEVAPLRQTCTILPEEHALCP